MKIRFSLIWALLALVCLPALHADYMDIVVGDRTVIQRGVIRGEDSARMIAVGNPGGFNYAFDAQNCTPVMVWQGEFLDFQGETNGRGGTGSVILGHRQPLHTAIAPLRIADSDTSPDELRFRGYRRDTTTGAPTFLFEVDGVTVEQTISSPAPDVVVLNLNFPAPGTQLRFYHLNAAKHPRVQLSDGLSWNSPGVIAIPAQLARASITLQLEPQSTPFARKVPFLDGEKLYRNYCRACHSTDGVKLIGPSFKNLMGDERHVTRDGREQTLNIDKAYLRESIVNPQAAIVKGYEAVPMANFSTILTDAQLDRLVDYLSGL
ncbi:cytochrome c [Opitutaceae bacterium]|nr:cytochrome c [Opitutaceae bacterium]